MTDNETKYHCYRICRAAGLPEHGWHTLMGTGSWIDVVERGTTRINLGGPGCVVTGRLKPPEIGRAHV